MALTDKELGLIRKAITQGRISFKGGAAYGHIKDGKDFW